MDEVVPGITENVRIDDSPDGRRRSAVETCLGCPPTTRAASIEPVPEITYDEQRYPARAAAAAPARPAPPQQRPPHHDRPAHGERRPTRPTSSGWCGRRCSRTPTCSPASSPGSPRCGAIPTRAPTRGAPSRHRDVWFTAYPISLITRPGESFLAALGEEELWEAFERVGITAIHTGPVKRAGGIAGWRETPERRRAFRPHQHADRSGVRRRGRVPALSRCRGLARRQHHRRHRARPHRQGRRLPARRDGVQGLPRDLPHDRDPAGGLAICCPTCPRVADCGQSRPRDRARARGARLHHRRAAARHLLHARA